jgi:predicted O-methyltransferase YrrM
MFDIDIDKILYENLGDLYGFYDIYRTTHADHQLESIVSTQKPINSVIEIGTGNGLSALIFAKYCKGMVFTFDVVRRQAEFIWSFFPELRKKIYYVTGSQEYIDESIKHIKLEADFMNLDFAFLDGDHTDKCLRHDYSLVHDIGIKRILFHDAHDPRVAPFMFNELHAQHIESLYAYLEVNQ